MCMRCDSFPSTCGKMRKTTKKNFRHHFSPIASFFLLNIYKNYISNKKLQILIVHLDVRTFVISWNLLQFLLRKKSWSRSGAFWWVFSFFVKNDTNFTWKNYKLWIKLSNFSKLLKYLKLFLWFDDESFWPLRNLQEIFIAFIQKYCSKMCNFPQLFS
jgi:hypothetical protein